jgi:hypothetical protein
MRAIHANFGWRSRAVAQTGREPWRDEAARARFGGEAAFMYRGTIIAAVMD